MILRDCSAMFLALLTFWQTVLSWLKELELTDESLVLTLLSDFVFESTLESSRVACWDV